jgi:hypothetical protein
VGLFAEWAAGFKGRPLSLFFLVLGTVLLLLAVTAGFQVPLLKQLVVDESYRRYVLVLGLVSLALGISFFFVPTRAGSDDWQLTEVRRWRVKEGELRASLGTPVGGEAWELATPAYQEFAVYGPYQPLPRGRYRATFRVKLSDTSGVEDAITAWVDVASGRGKKRLAFRDLAIRDFARADAYQGFPVDFYLLQDESDLEFRTSKMGDQRRLTLQDVTPYRLAGHAPGPKSGNNGR